MAGTNLGTAYISIMPSAKGMGSALSKQMESEGKTAGSKLGSGIAGTAMKVIAASGVAMMIKSFVSDSLRAGGELQQSFGGLDTIYGEAAEGMKTMAYEASKAGISANSYAEQAVSFGAALKQAWDGDIVSAAKQADEVIMDIADNSAKMGTDVSSVTQAFQGFAKQNYTMLDNLKLGYGGTKTEMERLLSDATALSGVEYNIDNLSDVYEAIHVIQGELGITGVAAAEAAETLQGSAQAMKASWENLKADMALGNDITKDLERLFANVGNYLFNNVLPMVGNVFKAIPNLLGTAIKTGFKKLPNLVESAKGLFDSIAAGFDGNGSIIVDKLKEIGSTALEAVKNTDWAGLGKSIINMIVAGLKDIGSTFVDVVSSIGSTIKEHFGGEDASWKEVGTNILKSIGEGLGNVGSALFEKVGEIGTKIKTWISEIDWAQAGADVVSAIGQGFQSFGEAVKTLWTSAKDSFGEIDWASVGSSIIDFIVSGLKAVGSFLWEALKTIGEAAWNAIKDIDWISVGLSIIDFITSGIRSIGSKLWSGLKSIGETAWSKIKGIDWISVGLSIIDFITSGMKSIGSNLWEALKGIGDTAWQKIKDIDWIGVGLSIIDFITSGLKSIGSHIWEALKEIGEAAWNKIKEIPWINAGITIIDFITSGARSTGSNVESELETIGNNGKDAITGLDWNGAGMDIDTKVSNGVSTNAYLGQSAGSSLASSIWNAVSGQDWGGLGASISSGISSGISPTTSVVSTAAFGSLGTKMVGIAKKVFGINSPSKLFRDEIGISIPEGIAVGINENDKMVTDAIDKIAKASVDTVDVDFSKHVTYSAEPTGQTAASPITINVYPSAGMDERSLADMVQQRLAFAQRQQQSAWGMA